MLRRFLAIATILMLSVASAFATTEIRVSSNSAGTSNCISAPETNQLISFHVVVFSDIPLASVSFQIQIPSILTWIDDTPDFAATTGASPIGTTVSFGACLSGPIHVMAVRCIVGNWDPDICRFAVVQNAVAVDCNGQPVTVVDTTSRVVRGPCEISGPSNPSPVDQGQDVPLITLLAWTGEGAHTCDLGEIIYYSLYFGTNPNPPFVISTQQVAFPGMAPPQPLLPGTQYYWRVLATQYGYNSSLSPVWTFRTAGPVPTRASTWGKIKALYRN